MHDQDQGVVAFHTGVMLETLRNHGLFPCSFCWYVSPTMHFPVNTSLIRHTEIPSFSVDKRGVSVWGARTILRTIIRVTRLLAELWMRPPAAPTCLVSWSTGLKVTSSSSRTPRPFFDGLTVIRAGGGWVSIVSDYKLDDRDSIPGRSKEFSSSLCVPTSLLSSGYRRVLSWGKARPGRDNGHSPI
jgi:hypothetical protein